jgi:formate/nitrite transporter FocA (FNT family)
LPAAPRPFAVHEAVRADGEADLARPGPALFWSALGAGLAIGFSFFVPGILHARLPDAEWRPLLTALGYPVGFVLVVLGRQQLFTQNTLTVVLPLLERPDVRTFLGVVRVWAIVLAGNTLGAVVVGWVAAAEPLFPGEVRASLATASAEVAVLPAGDALLRGVFAGWLIALLVWLLPVAGSGRVATIFIVTYVVALGGFPQIVTALVAATHAVAVGQAESPAVVGGVLLPVLAGNILGGVGLVALINHAQAVGGGVPSN